MVSAGYRDGAEAGRGASAGKERRLGADEASRRALQSARVEKFVVVSPSVLIDGALFNLYSR
jgi:hypothetical protein